MPSADESVFTSSPFKFVIDGNLLYVHAGLIALHSKPLNRMINGHMSEAQQAYAELQDVDKGTFIRFMERAYSGIYVAAEFRVEPTPKPGKKSKKGRKASNVAGQTANEIVDEPPSDTESTSLFGLSEPREPTSTPWSFGRPTKERFLKESTTRQLGIDFNESPCEEKPRMNHVLHTRNHDVPATTLKTTPPRSNEGPLEDYSEVFLSHARVYVFADKCDIEPLRKIALLNLYHTLDRYTLYRERCGDIIALIQYTYTHTTDRGKGVEGLRTLLKLYMGYEMGTLAGDKAFSTLLLEDGGAVLGDFLDTVIRKVK